MVVFTAAACAFTVLCMGLSLYSVSTARKRFLGEVAQERASREAFQREVEDALVEVAAKLSLAGVDVKGERDTDPSEPPEFTNPRRVVQLRPVPQ